MARVEMDQEVRVLELYSGIGGMHYALKESGLSFKIVAAIDINTTANGIYRHNFPDVNLLPISIEKVSLSQYEEWNIDCILMSPPCQPFTRVGNKKDVDDIRTKSFLHVLQLINKSQNKPQYILVENVKGFETSDARNCLIDTLNKNEYQYQEFLLTPLQFGIPNCRLRYYLIAKLKSSNLSFVIKEMPLLEIPDCPEEWLFHQRKKETNTSLQCPEWNALLNCEQNIHQVEEECDNFCDKCQELQQFLETDQSDEYLNNFLVPEKDFKWFIIMDIVHPALRKSMCFTKRYGHYINGAGPILQMSSCIMDFKNACDLKSKTVDKNSREFWKDEEIEIIRRLRLRYFTPREIANLLCFPMSFKFPTQFNRVQLYRCLGNSLNIHVVSILIKLMFLNG